MIGWNWLATMRSNFEGKKATDWNCLKICFKFVSFFNQSNESGNSKSGLNFKKKRVMFTIIEYLKAIQKLATIRSTFWGKKSDWFKLFEFFFKFVSFFLKRSNECGNSKSGLNFEQKRVMFTIIPHFFHPKKIYWS